MSSFSKLLHLPDAPCSWAALSGLSLQLMPFLQQTAQTNACLGQQSAFLLFLFPIMTDCFAPTKGSPRASHLKIFWACYLQAIAFKTKAV